MSKARGRKVLSEALRREGLGEHALAEQAGIDITLIRRYLRGEVRVGVKNAPKLARALNLPLAAVLYGRV